MTSSPTETSPLALLKEHWGHAAFRPGQEDIINSVLNGHDTLALLPTGGGKSICFQVPAQSVPAMQLVPLPLRSLRALGAGARLCENHISIEFLAGLRGVPCV